MTSADRQAIRQMLRFQLQLDREWSCRSEEEQWDEVDRIENHDQLEWIAAWGGVKSARNRVEARREAAGRMVENQRVESVGPFGEAAQRFSSVGAGLAGAIPSAVGCAD